MKTVRLESEDLFRYMTKLREFMLMPGDVSQKYKAMDSFNKVAVSIVRDKEKTSKPPAMVLCDLYDWYDCEVFSHPLSAPPDAVEMYIAKYNEIARRLIQKNPLMIHTLCTTGVFREASKLNPPILTIPWILYGFEDRYIME